MSIRQLIADDDVMSSFYVMKQLVCNLQEENYVNQVRRKEKNGYKLFALLSDNKITSVIGIRTYEYYGCGKFLIIDDLVTDIDKRSQGHGEKIFRWITKYAKENRCNEIHLDSGVGLSEAHKFYFKMGMQISNYHFTLNLKTKKNEQNS